MAYICENCGVTAEVPGDLCNPVGEEYKSKLCSIPGAKVCSDNASAMKYSCTCGNVSANPQHLCKPKRMW